MTDLAERLEQDLAPAWRPDKDDPDLLVGEVVSLDLGQSEYGQYPLMVVRQESGEEKAVHAFHTVLRNELIRARPQPGERIGIKYLGKLKAAEGSKYGSYIGYRVRMDRAAAEFDWSKIGAEPDPIPEALKPPEPAPVDVPKDAGDDGIPF